MIAQQTITDENESEATLSVALERLVTPPVTRTRVNQAERTIFSIEDRDPAQYDGRTYWSAVTPRRDEFGTETYWGHTTQM